MILNALLPEIINDPVMTAFPLNGNVDPPPPVPTLDVVKIFPVAVSNTNTLFALVVLDILTKFTFDAVTLPVIFNDPVTRTDPLTIALPVNGNVGGAKLALVANDAVPANGPMNDDADTVVANIDPVTINPEGNVTDPVKYDAVTAAVANEEEIALLAQLAVPKVDPLCVPINDPVNEPVNGRVNELNCRELETVPAGTVAIALNA